MRLYDIIQESFPIAKKEFSDNADANEVQQYINDYRTMLKQNFVKDANEKDINYWRKLGWKNFKEFVDYSNEVVDRNKKIKQRANRSIEIESTDSYTVSVPVTKEASQRLGARSTWCTSARGEEADNMFHHYFVESKHIKVIVVSKSDYNDNFAIRYAHNGSVEEVRDLTQQLTDREAERALHDTHGLSTRAIWEKLQKFIDEIKTCQVDQAGPKSGTKLAFVKKAFDEITDKILVPGSSTVENFKHLLSKQPWLKTSMPQAAEWYQIEDIVGMASAMQERWNEAEPYIMKTQYAPEYAEKVIKGRWPEAEPVILKSPNTASRYAEIVIKGRWPEAEPVIIKDPLAAAVYAEKVLKQRWPEAEWIIAKGPIYPLELYNDTFGTDL